MGNMTTYSRLDGYMPRTCSRFEFVMTISIGIFTSFTSDRLGVRIELVGENRWSEGDGGLDGGPGNDGGRDELGGCLACSSRRLCPTRW
jgi:hypothetical protein